MRKIGCIILTILMLFAYAAPVDAIEGERPYSHAYNEWDIIEALEAHDEHIMKALNIDDNAAESIVSGYYSTVSSRATMTDKQLAALGYTKESIELLRMYAEGLKLNSEQMRAMSATFYDSMSVSGNNTTSRKAEFSYNWEWSQAPFMQLKDSAGIIWKAVDSSGYELDVVRYKRTSSIKYYIGSATVSTVTNSTFQNIGFNGANVQFEMLKNEGDDIYSYAKKGTVTIGVKLDDSVTGSYNYVRVYAQYAHTTIGSSYPTLSVGAGGFSISFSPSYAISPQGGCEIKIYSSGSWEYL